MIKDVLEGPFWQRMRSYVANQDDLLNRFFGSYLAPDHAKWDRIDLLSEQLVNRPDAWELWLQRSILYLQCGVGLYAKSDAMEGLKLKQKCLLPEEKESSFYQVLMLAEMSLGTFEKQRAIPFWFKSLMTTYPISHRIDIAAELAMVWENQIFSKDPKVNDIPFSDDISPIGWGYCTRTLRMVLFVEALLSSLLMKISPVARLYSIALFHIVDRQWKMHLQIELGIAHQPMTALMRRYGQNPRSALSLSTYTCMLPLVYGRRNFTEIVDDIKRTNSPSTAQVAVQECSEKGGLKLVALKDFAADAVLFFETPICSFSAVAAGALNQCLQCWSKLDIPTNAPLQCVSCKGKFCNESCREDALSAGHDLLCSNPDWQRFCAHIANQATPGIAVVGNMVGLICKLQAMAKCKGVANALELPAIKALRNRTDTSDPSQHLQLLAFNDLIGTVEYIELIIKKFPNIFRDISLREIIELYNVIGCNSSGEGNDTLSGASSNSLYLIMSFMNNDCANANAGYITNIQFMGKRHLVTKSLRAIKAGEEITVAYNDVVEDSDRKCILRNVYRFLCECNKCKHVKVEGVGKNYWR
jgi:hypothetical protein